MGCCGTKKQPNNQQLPPKEKMQTEPQQQPPPIEIDVVAANVLQEQPQEVRAEAEPPAPPPEPKPVEETEEEKQKKLFQSLLDKEKDKYKRVTDNAQKIPIIKEQNNIKTYVYKEKCQDLDDTKLTVIDSSNDANKGHKKDIFEGLNENELRKLDANQQRIQPQLQMLEMGIGSTGSYIQKIDEINYHVRILRGVRFSEFIDDLTSIQNKQVNKKDLKLWKYYQRYRIDEYSANKIYGDLYLYSYLEKENLYQFAANPEYTIQQRLNLVATLLQRIFYLQSENQNLKESFISPNNLFVRQIIQQSGVQSGQQQSGQQQSGQQQSNKEQLDLFDVLISDWQFKDPKMAKHMDPKKQTGKVQRGYAPQPYLDDNQIGFNTQQQNTKLEFYFFQLALLVVFRINLSFDKNLSLDEKRANIYGIEDVFRYKIREAQNQNNQALSEARRHELLKAEFNDYINKENLQSVRQFIYDTFDNRYKQAWNAIFDTVLNQATKKVEFTKEALRQTLMRSQEEINQIIKKESEEIKQNQNQSPYKKAPLSDRSGSNQIQQSNQQQQAKQPISESQIDPQKKSKVYSQQG